MVSISMPAFILKAFVTVTLTVKFPWSVLVYTLEGVRDRLTAALTVSMPVYILEGIRDRDLTVRAVNAYIFLGGVRDCGASRKVAAVNTYLF